MSKAGSSSMYQHCRNLYEIISPFLSSTFLFFSFLVLFLSHCYQVTFSAPICLVHEQTKILLIITPGYDIDFGNDFPILKKRPDLISDETLKKFIILFVNITLNCFPYKKVGITM